MLWDQGERAESIKLLRQVLASERRVLKDDHPSTLLAMSNLASFLGETGQYEEGERLSRECVERRTRVLGEEDIDTLQSLTNLGNTLVRAGKASDAEPILRRAVVGRTKVLGETHPNTVSTKMVLARSLFDQKKQQEALSLYQWLSSPEILPKSSPMQQAVLLSRYGTCLVSESKFAEAEPILLRAIDQLTTTQMGQGEAMEQAMGALVRLCEETHRPAEASQWRGKLASLPTAAPSTLPAAIKP